MKEPLRRWLRHHPGLKASLSRRLDTLRRLSELPREMAKMPRNLHVRRQGAADGLPIPPDYLVFLVAGTINLDWFFKAGRAGSDSIRSALAEIGRPWETLGDVLDWGCGCGRVLRHLSGGRGPQLYGCDFNPRQIAWSTTAYPNIHFSLNKVAPPFPYPDSSFDLIYGLSVFTHLPEDIQGPWMRELARVLRPAGIAILSTHGNRYLPQLSEDEQTRFRSGRLVVRDESRAGSNVCMVFHPEAFVRTAMAHGHGFDVLLFQPEGAKGNPHQDLYVLEKRSKVATERGYRVT